MKNKTILIICVLSLIIFSNALISAVCCEKLKNNDMWCQTATTQSECDSKYTIWRYKENCETVPECHGTCINSETGECSENTDKTQCKESGGTWNESDSEDIAACQGICCLVGQDAYFVNPVECKNFFTENNIQGTIRTDITSRSACEEMQSNTKVGACVISTITEKACIISTNTDCTSSNINKLSEELKNPSSNIDVRFYEGILCTASINTVSISDCAKSEVTECKDNKVYYKDTCGNFANVYDANKYNTIDYWNYMKDSNDPSEVCTATSTGSSVCGNCDTTDNTVCQDYKNAIPTLAKPLHNTEGLVCGGLSCKYNGITYEHGDSWCAESPGILIIERNLTTGKILDSTLTKLKNASKYNLPGSRYYKLVCAFGEVLVEECSDYRNSVCMQGLNDDSKRKEASCVFNPWRTCLSIDTRTICEGEDTGSLCKWIPGYRTDYIIVPEADRKEMQGSCLPLIAPGFDFWNGTSSQGTGICAMGEVSESVLFETHWSTKRDDLAGTTSDSWDLGKLADRCLNGCFAIKDYAKEFKQRPDEEKQYPEEINCPGVGGSCSMYDILTEFYDEYQIYLPGKIDDDFYLSVRRGQYCHKKGDEEQWLTGKINYVSGSNHMAYDCTPGAGNEDKSLEKMRDYPIFLTNDEWVKSLTDKARSLGDCGYKASTLGKYSEPETEMITAIFQKLKQNQNVKENVTVEQIIYKGGAYLKGNLEKYETQLAVATSTGYTCPDEGGICTSTKYNAAPCTGGTASTTGTCATNMICCVYPELE